LSEGQPKAAGYRLVEGVAVASHAKKLAAQLGIVECGDRPQLSCAATQNSSLRYAPNPSKTASENSMIGKVIQMEDAMPQSALQWYQTRVREKMDSETISEVSRKLPGWFNRLFGWDTGFVTQDKQNRTWHVEYDGSCYCDETGETR